VAVSEPAIMRSSSAVDQGTAFPSERIIAPSDPRPNPGIARWQGAGVVDNVLELAV